MENNKLISLLSTFGKQDLYHFRKYLASPFFNEQETLVRLFDLLQEMPSSTGHGKKNNPKKEIWQSIFPEKKFNDTKFRRLFSDLLQLALDFLAHKQYEENPLTSRVLALRALTDSRLEKHFSGVVRQTTRTLEQHQMLNADHHYLSYMLNQRQHEQQEHTSPKSGNFHFLEQADYHLDCYYFIKKLEHLSDTLGYQDMTMQSAEINLVPGILEYLKSSSYLKAHAVRAWYLVVSMLKDQKEEAYFFQLKKLVEERGEYFHRQTRKNLLIHLMNYCIITKIHNDRHDYYPHLFELYQFALSSKVIYEKGRLPLHQYRNLISLSLHLAKFDWAENFIQTKTQDLPKDEQENALNYNLANVYFHQGDFEKVVEQLSVVEYQNIGYALGSKLLLVQAYFELHEIQPLDSLLDSFKVYLRRNRLISKEVKQRYLNFLRFTKKMASLAPYDEKGWGKVVGQIENCKSLVGKKWLLGKAPPNKN